MLSFHCFKRRSYRKSTRSTPILYIFAFFSIDTWARVSSFWKTCYKNVAFLFCYKARHLTVPLSAIIWINQSFNLQQGSIQTLLLSPVHVLMTKIKHCYSIVTTHLYHCIVQMLKCIIIQPT